MTGDPKIPDDSGHFVRLLWTGNDRVVRGQEVPASRIDEILDEGLNFPRTFQSLTYHGEFAADGPFDIDDEALLRPDPETYRELPNADRKGVMLCTLCDMDGTLAGAGPRSRLVEFLKGLSAEGRSALAAFESEFYLTRERCDSFTPTDESANMAADGMRASEPFVRDLLDALSAQELSVSGYHPEFGPGQQEVVLDPETGVTAADNQILYCQTVKDVAAAHGVHATFAPKPFANYPPSGCHRNLSLWDGETNEFYDEDATGAYPVSDTCRHFVGGLLDHADALMALTVPNVLSYRRFGDDVSSVPDFSCWGFGNRETLVRIPGVPVRGDGSSVRIEFKTADNTANPYLVLLGVLAAGMNGVQEARTPSDPVSGDPAALSADERETLDIRRLPDSLAEALDALESNAVLRDSVGDRLVESYVAVKRRQIEDFDGGLALTGDDVNEFIRRF